MQNRDSHGKPAAKKKNAERQLEMYYKNMAAIRAIKLLCGCMDCGSRDVGDLQFHHRDPTQRRWSVAGYLPWSTLVAEMRKCDLVCGECHGKRHGRGRIGRRVAV